MTKKIAEIVGHPDTPWDTEAKFWSWLRGGLRRAIWNTNPVKLQFRKSKRFKAPLGRKTVKNPEGLVWCCKCEICGEIQRESKCEVDHKLQSGSLTDIEHIQDFVIRLAIILFEDLQMLCIDCHKVINHCQRTGLSFEEAKRDKEVIKFKNLPAKKQIEIISKIKKPPQGDFALQNSLGRTNFYRAYLEERDAK